MMIWGAAIVVIFFLASGFRVIGASDRAVVTRFGHKRVKGPGLIWIIPFLDRLQRISLEPFQVSLPPQSAITKDEIPIQLQASLDAKVLKPELAVSVNDWRILLISRLQDLMKERLEELDFDRLDAVFPDWVSQIRSQMDAKADEVGVRILRLEISNLSPRTRPA